VVAKKKKIQTSKQQYKQRTKLTLCTITKHCLYAIG